jgi:hypothetical protein
MQPQDAGDVFVYTKRRVECLGELGCGQEIDAEPSSIPFG